MVHWLCVVVASSALMHEIEVTVYTAALTATSNCLPLFTPGRRMEIACLEMSAAEVAYKGIAHAGSRHESSKI